MNKIIFENAKDGSLTCSFNGKFLHSKYNPLREAENFAENLEFDFSPECILITEPAISYSALKIKAKFPKIKLAAIRYTREFDDYNSYFDYVFYAETKEEISNLQNNLLSKISGETLLSTVFLQWLPSSNVFSEQNTAAWQEIKNALNTAKAELFTNGFFSKRWFLNAIRLLSFSGNFFALNKTSAPIVICASGRSLKDSIPLLKKYRNRYHLIALSSAISALIENSLIPDLAFSTDGGFWAKKHLEILQKHPEIPLAIAAEGNAGTILLKKSKIIPLCYSDGFSKKIFDILNVKTQLAVRNGTVSGTAADFAMSLTTSKVFLCGLDLSTSKGYQHTMPNSLETFSKKFDCHTSSLEKRSVKAEFNAEALKIYEKWFSAPERNFSEKAYRLSDNFSFKNNLNSMKDVNFDFFEKIAENEINTNFELKKISLEKEKTEETIIKFIEKFCNTEAWTKEFFPAEYFSSNHKKNSDEKKLISEEIKKKNILFTDKIKKLAKK